MSKDEDGEKWTVVLATDKKRVMRKSGIRRKLPCAYTVSPTEHSIIDTPTLRACLCDCMDYLVTTKVWLNLIQQFDAALSCVSNGDDVCALGKQIVAFGIGNFSKTGTTYYSAPLFQLAIAECLRRYWTDASSDGDVSFVFFDPCSTPEEVTFLKEQLHCNVLTSNDKGNHPAGTATTLFFMPHCPAQLYEHVVWSNFDAEQRIISLGNSLSHLAQNVSRSKVYRCIQAIQPWLHEMEIVMCPADWKGAPGNLHGAMNDTYMSYYRSDGNPWPPRPYEAWSDDSIDDPELL